MAVIEFVRNYDDLSSDQGFQFKFYCNHCGNGYQSTFVANKLNVAEGFLRAAGSIFGGALGGVSDAAYNIQRAVGGPQHDAALRAAVEECKPLFTQCHRCGQWVCGQVCWNAEKALCKECAPDFGEEVASAQAQAAKQQLYSKAMETDMTRSVNMTDERAAHCPQCGAAVSGTGKFCTECGAALAAPKRFCGECGGQMEAGAKFCPGCGAKSAA